MGGRARFYRPLGYLAAFVMVQACWGRLVLYLAGLAYLRLFAFGISDPANWRGLHLRLLAGETIPFSFFVLGLFFVLLALLGLILTSWRLPAFLGWLSFLPGAGWLIHYWQRARGPRPRRLRSIQVLKKTEPAPIQPPADFDRRPLIRAMAVFAVCQDAPEPWMVEVLAEEIGKIAAADWAAEAKADRSVAGLVRFAQELGLLPGLVLPDEEAASPGSSTVAPAPLTLTAGWLTGLLENYQDLLDRQTRAGRS
ncbi:MAG TPA: hypothetical protein HPP80_07350, partial [Rhodospirillaceae bacterium]|nr:hypothetical protein [Rhodospirillaceae bacterium]